MSVSRLSKITAIAVGALCVYYTVFRWIPLGRWNWQFHWPVANDQFYPDIVICTLLGLFAVAFLRRWLPVMWIATVLLTFWAVVHLFDWWIPYATDSAANFARYSFYAPHTQLLPVIGHHYPPDGSHAVLDFLVYPTWLLSLPDVHSMQQATAGRTARTCSPELACGLAHGYMITSFIICIMGGRRPGSVNRGKCHN